MEGIMLSFSLTTVINSQPARLFVLTVAVYILWRSGRKYFDSYLAEIPGPAKISWWKGNFDQIYDRRGWNFHRETVNKYGGVVKLHGLLGEKILYVTDPRALYHIVVKDQNVFEETSMFLDQNSLVFGPCLISTAGERHRKQRKMMNPVFSLRHMRGLIEVFYPIAHELRDVLARRVGEGEKEINIMGWMSRAALEYMGQGGLGYTFHALDETRVDPYGDAVRMLIPASSELFLFRRCIPFLSKMGPSWFRRKLLEWTPYPALQRVVKIVDFMDSTSQQIFKDKKAAIQSRDQQTYKQVALGKDIMSVLLKANMETEKEERLPESELLGQMNLFLFGGFDTVTSALSRTLDLLALHPSVQNRLSQEVRQARSTHGDLDYDTLMALPYLDAVIRETLRVHPPAPMMERMTNKDIILPLSSPIKPINGEREISEIPLRRNTRILVSIVEANNRKDSWGDDAWEWKPERWLGMRPDSVAKVPLPGVYSSMMTFMGGSRACIGFKFAELEMKVVLSILLESFQFSPTKEIYWNMDFHQSPMLANSEDTSPQLPLKLSLRDD